MTYALIVLVSFSFMVYIGTRLKALMDSVTIYHELIEGKHNVISFKQKPVRLHPPITTELIEELESMGVIVDEKLKTKS